jgi:hypothetical protein
MLTMLTMLKPEPEILTQGFAPAALADARSWSPAG